MPVRIRLQRHGRKGRPFYWIVAADSRSRRDGRYLEKLGTYDPNVNPAIVNIKVNEAVKWLENGAQPSDTARTLLSYKGVMLRHHLNKGVKKGALTVEQADKKFENWLSDKEKKIQDKIKNLLEDENKKRESKIKSEREYSLKREEKTKLNESGLDQPIVDSTEVANDVAEVKSEDKKPAEESTEVKSEDKKPAEEATEVKSDDQKPAEDATEVKSEDKKPAEEATEVKSEDKKPAEDATEVKLEDKKSAEEATEVKSEDKKSAEEATEVKSEDEKSTEENK